MLMEFRRVILLSAVLVLVLLPSLAMGEIGPALTGLTGSATDATAAFFSPAGITRLDRPQVLTQTVFAYTSAKFDVDDATIKGGDGESNESFLVIPGIFYSRPLSKRIYMGLSFNVPSGFGTDYGGKWSGRYLSESNTLTMVAASATLAFQVTEGLSLAVGPYLMFVDEESKARVNNIVPGHSDGRVELEESGEDVGVMFGAMYQFTDSARIGLTYRTELEPDLDGTPTFHNLDPLLRESLAALDLLGTEIDVDFKVPQQLQLGFQAGFGDHWSMTGDVIWIDMSEFGVTHVSVEEDSISVDGTFQDMMIATASLKYGLGKGRAISVGASYAESPVENSSERLLGLPLDRAIGGGVGFEMPIRGFLCHVNLNVFDLGDGKVDRTGGPLTGSVEGSFSENYAVALDFQFTKRF